MSTRSSASGACTRRRTRPSSASNSVAQEVENELDGRELLAFGEAAASADEDLLPAFGSALIGDLRHLELATAERDADEHVYELYELPRGMRAQVDSEYEP